MPKLHYECGCRWTYLPSEITVLPIEPGWYLTLTCTRHHYELEEQIASSPATDC